MRVKTTLLGHYIIKEAEDILALRYIEPGDPRKDTTKNIGTILENLIKEFDQLQPNDNKKFAGVGKKQLPYCAMTASVIIDRAVKRMSGQTNTCRTSGAKEFIAEGKKHKIRVDNKPAIGAVFLTPQGKDVNARHAGIVWKIDGKYIDTIEGNAWAGSARQIGASGCLVDASNQEGIISRRISISQVKEFVHVEELAGTEQVEREVSDAYLADGYTGDMCSTEDVIPDTESGSHGNSDLNNELIPGIPNTYLYVGGGALLLLAGYGIYRKMS